MRPEGKVDAVLPEQLLHRKEPHAEGRQAKPHVRLDLRACRHVYMVMFVGVHQTCA